jgi:hypothetical protein
MREEKGKISVQPDSRSFLAREQRATGGKLNPGGGAILQWLPPYLPE